MNGKNTQDAPSREGITRRQILMAGGTTLVGATLLGSVFETALGQTKDSQDIQRRGITSKDGGMKPTFLPEAGSTDAVAHSVAENLFWNEQMMEHAKFFVMLMPGPELAGPRRQAEQFQQTFAGHLEKARAATSTSTITRPLTARRSNSSSLTQTSSTKCVTSRPRAACRASCG